MSKLRIYYLVPGDISVERPLNWDNMNTNERFEWANEQLDKAYVIDIADGLKPNLDLPVRALSVSGIKVDDTLSTELWEAYNEGDYGDAI